MSEGTDAPYPMRKRDYRMKLPDQPEFVPKESVKDIRDNRDPELMDIQVEMALKEIRGTDNGSVHGSVSMDEAVESARVGMRNMGVKQEASLTGRALLEYQRQLPMEGRRK